MSKKKHKKPGVIETPKKEPAPSAEKIEQISSGKARKRAAVAAGIAATERANHGA